MNAEQQDQQQHPEVSFTAEENENEPMLDNNGNNNNNSPSSNNNNDDDDDDVDADMNNNNHNDEEEQQPVDNEPDWNEIMQHEPARTGKSAFVLFIMNLCVAKYEVLVIWQLHLNLVCLDLIAF